MDQFDTKDWPSLLDNALQIMNNRVNREIGIAPNAVTINNSNAVFKKLYPNLAANKPIILKPKFKIHDKVRVLYQREDQFSKSAIARGSLEIFSIYKVLMGPVISYRLKNVETGELITGRYQEKELIKA